MAMTTEPQQSQQGDAAQRGAIPVDSFANRLMLARAHAGHLSIRDAAELCDIGRGAWTNWEKGAKPSDIIDIATAVADKLGVDRDWLLFGGQLGEAEVRQPRRRGGRSRSTHGYSTVTDHLPAHTYPERGNRPPGRPSGATRPGVSRTAYVDRADRRRRDR